MDRQPRTRVARIEARATCRATRADIQAALFGEAPDTRIIWEMPGKRETSWLVQVPEELAVVQMHRFEQLRIHANLLGYRTAD